MGNGGFIPVLIGPLSGPVHGVFIINNALHAAMVQHGLSPMTIDLSPGLRSRGPAYHLVRMARTVAGVLRVLGAALAGKRLRAVMHLDGGAGLIYNIVLTLALRATGQAVLFYHHSSSYVLATNVWMRILLKLAGRAPQVFCSPQMAQLFLDRYGVQATAVIINNAAWISPPPKTPAPAGDGRLRLGFLGALSLEKGLGRAVETLRVLRGRGVAAELALAGAPHDPAMHKTIDAAAQEFGPALRVCGVVQGPDKARFLAGLDYCLFPSLYPHETQSLVVPEALSYGAPVIACDHRFVAEVVGQGGFLVSPADDYAAAAANWIQQGDAAARRPAARQQFDASHRTAAGQVDRLIAWSRGDLAGLA